MTDEKKVRLPTANEKQRLAIAHAVANGMTLTGARRNTYPAKYARKDARTYCLLKAYGRGGWTSGQVRDLKHPAADVSDAVAEKFRGSLRLAGWDKDTKAAVAAAFKERLKAWRKAKKAEAASAAGLALVDAMVDLSQEAA